MKRGFSPGFLARQSSSLIKKHSKFIERVSSQGAEDGGEIKYQLLQPQLGQISIHNPSRKNAISGKMMSELAHIVDHLSDHKDVNRPLCVILRGSHGMFCSGADLNLAKNVLNSTEKGLEMSALMTETLNKFKSLDIISLALLTGPALGGGSEISTSTDFRLMLSSSSDPHPYKSYISFIHAKLGAAPGWGGARRLYDIVGRNKALYLLGTSCRVFGSEAVSIGLADGVATANSVAEETAAAVQFLEPFLSQQYPQAVRDFKSIVVANDENQFNSSSSSSQPCSRASEVETAVFGRRWFGKDNVAAFNKSAK